MKLTKEHQEWIKANRAILLEMMNGRKEDYFSRLIDEEDENKSKVIKMWIRELQAVITTVNNISAMDRKTKKKKKNTPDFTGI